MVDGVRFPSGEAQAPFDAAIGLGSNIGDKAGNVARAVRLLTEDGAMRLVGTSRLYRSAPWGVLEQEPFVNAVVTVATELAPRALLARCQGVEAAMGRVRARHWGPRIIDVDILSYRDQRVDASDLVIPHPFIAKRSFVLVPLKDVAPDLTVDGRSLDDLIAAIDTSDLVPLD